jgi:hypothetical protein
MNVRLRLAGMTSADGGQGDGSVPRLKVPWLGEILRSSQDDNASQVLLHVFIAQHASGMASTEGFPITTVGNDGVGEDGCPLTTGGHDTESRLINPP